MHRSKDTTGCSVMLGLVLFHLDRMTAHHESADI